MFDKNTSSGMMLDQFIKSREHPLQFHRPINAFESRKSSQAQTAQTSESNAKIEEEKFLIQRLMEIQ